MTTQERYAYEKIIVVFDVRMQKDGYYHTAYGKKTAEGLMEVMAAIMRDMGVVKDVKPV